MLSDFQYPCGNYPYHLRLIEKEELSDRSVLLTHEEGIVLLIVDIDGFSISAKQAGIEAQRKFLIGFFSKMTWFAWRYGGWPNKFTGDGLLIQFMEPQQAYKAAQDMQMHFEIIASTNPPFDTSRLVTVAGVVDALTGRIGSEHYFDYSIWTHEVNTLFHASKKLKAGYVWFNDKMRIGIGTPKCRGHRFRKAVPETKFYRKV